MTTKQKAIPTFDEIQEGDELPTLAKQPGELQLFMFSAITWDTHRTHWDIPYSVDVEDLPGILVHGHLQGSWLTQIMSDWVVPNGKVAYVKYQNRGMAIQNEKLFVKGRVKGKAAEDGKRQVADLVNISSVAGRIARGSSGVYNLTKFGVTAFSEALRQEVGGRHVRISVVEPGAVATELITHVRREVLAALAKRFGKMDPLLSEDIADAVAYIVTRPRRVAVNEMLVRPTNQEM